MIGIASQVRYKDHTAAFFAKLRCLGTWDQSFSWLKGEVAPNIGRWKLLQFNVVIALVVQVQWHRYCCWTCWLFRLLILMRFFQWWYVFNVSVIRMWFCALLEWWCFLEYWMRFDVVRLKLNYACKQKLIQSQQDVMPSGSLQGLFEFLECCGLGVNHLRHG